MYSAMGRNHSGIIYNASGSASRASSSRISADRVQTMRR
jgi:hypothetical protein